MATNPKIPPRRNVPANDRSNVVIAEKRNTWWPPVLIICALAVIGALIWWLGRSPNRNAAPTTVNGQGMQLTQLTATTPTTNGAFAVMGTLVNNGTAPITGVKVEAAFKNIQGQTLEKIPGNVEPARAVQVPQGATAGSSVDTTPPAANPAQTHGFVKPGGGEGSLTQSTNRQNPPMTAGFANQPVQPGQSIPIAIQFTHVPSGWVGGVPPLKIMNVETAQQTGAATK